MDKNLKQADHVKSSSYASKKIMALSFVAAVQTLSCISGRRQGFIASHETGLLQYTDLSALDQDSPEFKKLQNETVKTVSERFAESNKALAKSHVQAAFFKAIKECNLRSVKSLSEHPSITSKEVAEGLRVALKHKDTFSFRYKHEKIVDFLLRQHIPSLEDLCAQDEKGRTLLYLAIKRPDLDALKFLVEKLSLEGLCDQDGKGRTSMYLAAQYKGKKMFSEVFKRIYELNPVRAIEELFKKDKKGYSVIERSYLRKDRHFAALWNNSHINLPTFCRQGSEMFKFILKTIPIPLGLNQLVTIAIGLEKTLESKIISSGYAATLRTILKCYIEDQYGCNAYKVIRYVSYKRQLDYIKDQKEAQEYENKHKELVHWIREKYGSEIGASDNVVDEGYISG